MIAAGKTGIVLSLVCQITRTESIQYMLLRVVAHGDGGVSVSIGLILL